ncbi:TetR/AcrR family transcriptional regulator [Pseudomonas sp. F1_0610]|uniref:TetR/AcrR family transcriptional regulator n=1 Tax=Pseudomonas sp. F1_0610 TaxID=3114284 RepID=UPI0039C04751
MTKQTHNQMSEETRSKLLHAARQAFTEKGFANTAMDELTANVGLTRGALYHHFGDKKGLLAAVVRQIDQEIDTQLAAISQNTADKWEAFVQRCLVYLKLVQQPQVQRIVLLDARTVLGHSHLADSQCVLTMQHLLEELIEAKLIQATPTPALAQMLLGALEQGALWVAQSKQTKTALAQAEQAMLTLLSGLD